MRKLIYTFILFAVAFNIKAQQMGYTSPLQELQHIWNPAFTAYSTNLEFTGFYRKQWIGFNNAPNTAAATIQYPFVDMNMSAGVAIISDKTGPISKLGLQLSYAYKLKELFSRDDQLSLGINGFFHQYRFDPSEEILNQPDDVLVMQMMNAESKFVPSMGFGFAYFTSTKEYDGDNIFYIGASALQLLKSEVPLSTATAPRERHYFINVGSKFYGYETMIEPSVQINYLDPEIIDIVLGVKYELEETFWAGLNYSSLNELSINGGVILNDVGDKYSSLKIGVMANINAGAISSAGPGLEFYIAYRFDMD